MSAVLDLDPLAELARGVEAGRLIPYLGPGVLALTPGGAPVPDSPEAFCRHIESLSGLDEFLSARDNPVPDSDG